MTRLGIYGQIVPLALVLALALLIIQIEYSYSAMSNILV